MIAALWSSAPARSESPYAAAEQRHENFNDMLDALRSFQNEAKSDAPEYTSMQASAARMEQLIRAIPQWFPAGSGPESGARTNARPEIWQNWNDFRAKTAAAQSAAEALRAAVGSHNAETISAAERALRSTCRSCHQTYEYGNF